jgi:dTMP kinase
MKGKLITLEGIDGAGKSTVAKKLLENPEVLKYNPIFTREPTLGTFTGAAVEQAICSDTDQLTELFLFTADHAEHLAKLVRPSLENGRTVISDRYSDSRYAYQSVTLRSRIKKPLEWVRSLHEGWTIAPDLTFLFVIEPEVAVERCGKRGEQTKFEKIDFLKGVQEAFFTLAAESPNRFVIVDANRPLKKVETEVTEKLLEYLQVQ